MFILIIGPTNVDNRGRWPTDYEISDMADRHLQARYVVWVVWVLPGPALLALGGRGTGRWRLSKTTARPALVRII